jgi:hypothetical protein
MFFQLIKKNYNIFLFVPLLICMAGCTKRVNVTSITFADTDKIEDGFPLKSSFCILPAQNGNRIFVKKVTKNIANILEERDYCLTDAEVADYYLTFDFGTNNSTHIVNRLQYIPGQNKTTSGNSDHSGGIYSSGSNVKYNGHGTYQQKTVKSGTFVPVPEEVVVVTTGLTIIVYDAVVYRESKVEEEVWRATANSSGYEDIRPAMEYLLETVFKKFGKESYKAKTIVVF